MREIEHLARFSLILLILLFFSTNIYSQKYPNADVNRLLEDGIELITNQNYDSAKIKLTELERNFPKLPLGKIYLAVTEITKTYDYGESFNSKIILKLLDDALEQSEERLEKEPENVWNNYFVALSRGYLSYFRVLNDEWLSAISNGVTAVQYFENCLEIDSAFYESFVAIGNLKFWKSRKLEILNWIPFFKDESGEGIAYLEMALNTQTYSKNLTALSLIWIYIEDKNFNRAIQIAEQELKLHPGNRAIKWALARAYEDVDLNLSIQLYKELIASYQKIKGQNHYHEITLKHIVAQQYQKLGMNNEALRFCNEILSTRNLSDNVRQRLADRFERVMNLKEELSQ